MARASVVVVGGGISALAAAWELTGGDAGPTDQTPRVEVIEASGRFGGALATTAFADRTVDLGADGFLARRPEATALVRELGLEDRLEAIAVSGSSIWLRGALHELPAGLMLGVPTSSKVVRSVRGLSWRARMDARRDEIAPRRLRVGDDATIGEILRTKLGRELTYQFIEPMVGGIQAGRIDQLSARAVFPPLLEAARRGGSLMKALAPPPPAPGAGAPAPAGPLFYSLLDGVGSLPVELVRRLAERDVVLRLAVPVTALRRTPADRYPWQVDTASTTTPADQIILAAPATVAGRLLADHHASFTALQQVVYAGAAMITFSVARENVTLPATGTGVLVPLATAWSGEGSMMMTAITLLDRKWPHLVRDDDVLMRVHVGRSDDRRWEQMDDRELADRVARELAELLGRFGPARDVMVQRWPAGLPQYYVGHDVLVSQVKREAEPLGLSFAGSAYDGVGVPASIGSGRRAAREVLERLARDRGSVDGPAARD